MKILFVTHRYPPNTGGVETHVQKLATRLVDRGHDVTVFSADADSELVSETTEDGVRVRRFKSLHPGGAFYLTPRIALAVRRANADVVHAHNYHAFPLFFAALGVKDERFVVTTHYHGGSASGFRDALLSLYRPFGRWAVRQADEVIAVSEWENEQLQENFGVDATVVPNGVEVERFVAAEPEERDRPYLLVVGRLEEYKGVQHAIRALTELPEYELVVAGSGPYREKLEAVAAAHDVANRVSFLGFVAGDRLQSLYAGAEVYLTLSSFEAYGMTVGEALATGTPCVVRNAKALRNWISRNDCVAADGTEPEDVAATVRDARDRTADQTTLPTWSDAVEDVLNCCYSK